MSRTNTTLWDKTVASVKAGTKGGGAGQWSARKAQLAGKIYKDKGGSYSGEKTTAQKSLTKWTKEEWGTKSGKPSTEGPKATGERYLPKKAREALTKEEYSRTTAKKRQDTKEGKQFSKQPESIAKKAARFRK